MLYPLAENNEPTMKRRTPPQPDRFNWAFLFLVVVIAGVHLYLGLFATSIPEDRATQFIIIGLALLFGPVVYFTSYWRPVLYLLGVSFAMYLGTLWVLGGMKYYLFGILAGITATSFILLGLYLFLREEMHAAQTEERDSRE